MCMTFTYCAGSIGFVATDTRVTTEIEHEDGTEELRFEDPGGKLRRVGEGFAVACGSNADAGFRILDRIEGLESGLGEVREAVQAVGETAEPGHCEAACVYALQPDGLVCRSLVVDTDGRDELVENDWHAQVPRGLEEREERLLSLRLQEFLLDAATPFDLFRVAARTFRWAGDRTDYISEELAAGLVLATPDRPERFRVEGRLSELIQASDAELLQVADSRKGAA